MGMSKPYAGMRERIAPMIGQFAARSWTDGPIETSAIRAFCGAVEYANPVYWLEDVARTSRFGRLIAPPQSLMALNMDAWWMPEYLQNDMETAHQAAPETRIRNILAEYGFAAVLVVERTEEYLGAFGPGDGRMGRDRRVTNVSEVKTAKVGTGVFLTYEIDYFTERDERHVATARNVTLIYDPTGASR
jgi:hypothetical protein